MMTLDDLLAQVAAPCNPFKEQKWRKSLKPKGFLYTVDLMQKIAYARERQDANLLEVALTVAGEDGVDRRYTQLLLQILPEPWHHSAEDIVMLLEEIQDPGSVDLLYRTAWAIPSYDDGRSLARKCIWALGAINTMEAREKLLLLERVNDPIIQEVASMQLRSK